MLRGLYNEQVDWIIQYLHSGRIGADQTVVLLHPLDWFNSLPLRFTPAKP